MGKDAATRIRIMIVEDEFFTAVGYEAALDGSGFDVVGIASTFEEALSVCGRELPDLVIMDIRLASRKDGVDTAMAIRSRHDIPSIFVTAFGDTATRQRAEPARPLGWLIKPFTMEELVDGVRQLTKDLPRGS